MLIEVIFVSELRFVAVDGSFDGFEALMSKGREEEE